MASSPITSWQIEGEKVKTVTDFIFLASKITVDGNCSHEIKRCLLLGRKATTILKVKKLAKTKIMASGPITSWQIDGQTVETVSDYFLGSKITADGNCIHEIKRCLLLGRKVMTNLAYSKADTLL